jgi:PAS domain S-box-containing protein
MPPLTNLFSESEKNYLDLFKLSPQPMWVYDICTLAFLDVNDAAVQHYGYSREEFFKMTIRDIRPAEDLPLLENMLKQGPDGRKKLTARTYRHKTKNGALIDVQIQSNPLDLPNLSAELILVYDITAMTQSQRDLQASRDELLKSERLFEALVQEGSDLTAILDVNGYYQFVSKSFTPILSLSTSEIIGHNALDYVHPDDIDRISAILANIQNVKRVTIEPYRFKDRDNNWRWLTTTATNLLDDPHVQGIVTNSTDVTTAIQKNEELKHGIERYKLVLKASDEAICDWDIVNDTVDWGSGFRDIFGYDLTKYNNTLWSENLHQADRLRVLREVQSAISDPNREIYYSEYRFHKANREVINIQHRGIFLRDKQGRAIRSVDTLKDITPHIRRIEHIEKQNQQLRQIAWSQSHDVRGPLARILALADLLTAEPGISKTQEELLNYLNVSAQELDSAIKEIIRKTEDSGLK